MAKYKALLIDDNTQFTDSVKGFLLSQDRFSEVDTAQDGREALKKLREKTYDVMTLDLIMPNADGLVVLEQMSLLPLDPAPAVVVISALKNEAVDPDTISKRLLETLEGEPVKGGVMPYAPTHRSFEEKVTAIFLVAGIPAHIKGYHYLREGIRLVYNDPDLINRITKELYPGIAKRFDTSPSKVERAIRHAIEVAWTRGKIENLNALFGYNIYGKNDKPTNGEFIALVADKLLMEEQGKKAG